MRVTPSAFTRRLRLGATMLALFLVVASASPAAGAEIPNPDYEKWAALEAGSWVRVRITGDLRHADWKYTLVRVTPEAAVLRVAETRFGGKPSDKPREERVPATLVETAAAAAADEPRREEELKVGDVALKCRRDVRRRAAGAAEKEPGGGAEVTTWVSDEVPGFVKRVTVLAANAEAGLPEGKTVETLVGYELKERAAGAKARGGAAAGADAGAGVGADSGSDAEAPANEDAGEKADPRGEAGAKPAVAEGEAGKPEPRVRRAGELGPSRFKWTYTFDPPGWRRWERVGETEWVEHWQTGEAPRFEIVRRIDDGERVGTVVTRLPDRDAETVIPDAGKGATLWFRTLPDGEWVSLGQLEESE